MTRVSSFHSFFSSNSLLLSGCGLSHSQVELDATFHGISEEISHWQSLTAMSLGGLAYRLSKIGILSVGVSTSGRLPLLARLLAPALSLGGEVGTYELSQRGLLSLSGDRSNPNLFRWSGTGGLWEGLKNSYVNFGFLKLGGLFHSQNILLQHLTQATAMVAGHEATAQLGWVPHENGSLLERLIRAEETNIQLGFAMSLVHRVLPGLGSLERNLSAEALRSHFSAERNLHPDFSNAHLHRFLSNPARAVSERREQLNVFVEEGANQIAHPLESYRDRGIIIAPKGTREIFEAFLTRQLNLPPEHRNIRHLRSPAILVVAFGAHNLVRLRRRLDRVFSTTQSASYFRERHTWRRNGLRVDVISVHSLSRFNRSRLESFLARYGMLVLDKEHHVRMVDDSLADPLEGISPTERKRFGNILLAGGWMEETHPGIFQRRRNPNTFLLGLTESVLKGAGLIYGVREGCLLATNLAEMESRGLLLRPQVSLVIPESIQEGESSSIRDRWRSLSLQERVDHMKGLIDYWAQQGRERGDPSIPRVLINAGSQDEAVLLSQVLEADPTYVAQVALMISRQDLLARKETDQHDFLNLRTKRIGIQVETLVEGVDEFDEHPVDYVILAGAERAGGLRYALQTIGAHLGNDHPPQIIDVCGMLCLHPELAFFDPSVFVFSEGEVRRGTVDSLLQGPAPVGTEILRSTQIYAVDIFVENVARNLSALFSELFPHENLSRLARILNLPESWVSNLWQGDVLPTRFALQNFIEQLGLTDTQAERVWDVLAEDRMAHYDLIYPIDILHDLSGREMELLIQARRGFFRYYENFDAIGGIGPEMLQRFLESGVIPDRLHTRSNFLNALASVLFGPDRVDEGMRFITEVFGLAVTRDFWIPETTESLVEINRARMEAWFSIVYGSEPSNDSQEITLQFRRDPPNRIIGFRILRAEEGNLEDNCRIRIQRRNGGFRIIRARGYGGVDAINRLRASVLSQEACLDFRSESWLFYDIATTSRMMFEIAELRNIEARDLNAWFDHLSQVAGGPPLEEMVLQFIVHERDFLTSLVPTTLKNRAQEHNYGKVWIQRVGDKYRITRIKGAGADRVLEFFRGSTLAEAGTLSFRPTSWLYHDLEWEASRLFQEEDLEFIEIGDIERWFEYASRKQGSPSEEVRLGFFRSKTGTLSGLRPVELEEEVNNARGWLRILRNGPGKYRITEAKQSGSGRVVEILRRSHLAQVSILEMRPSSWLVFDPERNSSAFQLEDLKWIETPDLDRFFALVSRGRTEPVQRIVLQYKGEGKAALTAFAPVSEEVFDEDANTYSRILLEKRENGKYRLIGARNNCDSVLEVLRRSFLAGAGHLEIRPDSWLYYHPERRSRQFSEEDFRVIEVRDLESWFQSVESRVGARQDNIVVQFTRSSSGLISGMTPVLPNEVSSRDHFVKLSIERPSGGAFRLHISGRPTPCQKVLEQFRQSQLFRDGILQIS